MAQSRQTSVDSVNNARSLLDRPRRVMHNGDIANVFDQIANLLDIQQANPFRVRAYRQGAQTLRQLPKEVADMVDEESELEKLPAIGTELSAKIHEILQHGSCTLLHKLHHEIPPSIETLLSVPGLGPRRVATLFNTLGITDSADLSAALASGQVNALPGFGEKTVDRLQTALITHQKKKGRFLRAEVTPTAQLLRDYMNACETVDQAEIAGSFRRGKPTVGDLDVLVSGRDVAIIKQHFFKFEHMVRKITDGPTRASAIFSNDLQVDLRIVEPKSYGAALVYFTGSKAHNIRLRTLAQRQRLKLNEYGLFRGQGTEAVCSGRTEKAIYAGLKLAYIPPELRENRGEIQAARINALPDLVERADIRGDLNVKSNLAGGWSGIKDIASSAQKTDYEYIAIADCYQTIGSSNKQRLSALSRQLDEIDALNKRLSRSAKPLHILKAVEVDIQADGAINSPKPLLDQLDFVIGVIHTDLNLPRAKQTRRLLRAMEDKTINILSHPACRQIQQRTEIDVNWHQVFVQARQSDCWLEHNADPNRLDLSDVNCRRAKEIGVSICINSGATHTRDLVHMDYGVTSAKRGWLQPHDVINTLTRSALLQRLHR